MQCNKPFRYLLSFGSNLGNRRENFSRALSMLKKHVKLIYKSRDLSTEPLISDIYDTSDHDYFLNCIVDIKCHYQPNKLYDLIVFIENTIGHDRKKRWAPRHIDIDILLVTKSVHSDLSKCSLRSYNHDGILIPHTELRKRFFLIELICEYLHISAKKLDSLLDNINEL